MPGDGRMDPLFRDLLFTSIGPPGLAADYTGLTGDVAAFLDALAGARVDAGEVRGMRATLQELTRRLDREQVSESERQWGHWAPLPGRGQTLVPAYVEDSADSHRAVGRVTFGRSYVGENMAVHGGAVSLLFDDFLGRLANRPDGGPARTAFLTVNYRSITPVGKELRIEGTVARLDGRKRFLAGRLCHGDVVCAEADGLWLELRMGQR